MKSELEKHIEEFKRVLEILPSNNKSNLKKKLDYIDEEEKTNNKSIEKVLNEINKRISTFDNLKQNPKIDEISKKLETSNIVNEWNEYNTSYEKMHLDFYLYQLKKYYKSDLNNVNECLKRLIKSFDKVGVSLRKEDFNFNNYAAEYMNLIINNSDDETLKTKFEEIYWKFPELIKTIEINFKSIYQRYEKKIDKHYQQRNAEYLKSNSVDEILKLRIDLSKELKSLKHKDEYLIFNKFKDGSLSLSTFSSANIDSKINLYFSDGVADYDTLLKLSNTLFEYGLIIKYGYLLDDMSARLERKDEFKNIKNESLKAISQGEKKLVDLNKAYNKKSLFKKNDEKWLFKYKEILNDIISKYDEFDNICFSDLIYNRLSQTSTILDVFKLVTSNYLYFVAETKKKDDDKNISDITQEFNELKEDINSKEYSLLNNLVLLDKKDIKLVIADKYKLEGINLSPEILEEDNLDKINLDINEIIQYQNICESNIDLSDVELYLDFQKINNKK